MRTCRDYRSIFPLTPTEVRRLMAHVDDSCDDPSHDCWEWTGSTGAGGYGRVLLRGSWWQAHRMVYELLIGPVPVDLILHHRCRNKRCCNPAHLKPVTQSVNKKEDYAILDPDRPRSLKKHCRNGHLFSDDNILWKTVKGKRVRFCRACTEAAAQRKNTARRLRRAAAAAQRASAAAAQQEHSAEVERISLSHPQPTAAMAPNESEVLPCSSSQPADFHQKSPVSALGTTNARKSLHSCPSSTEAHP